MKKRLFALLLAVLMLCALVGCGNTQPDGKDTPTTTTTTKQETAPIALVEGEIPSDCFWLEDASSPAHNVAVMIKANVNLADVQWLALNPDPPTVDRVLYHRSLNKDEIWAINTYINDAVPNRGVACVDESGKTYYYAIAYSMKGDGSPSLNLTALNIEELSEAKLDEIETYLNDKENNGFVSMNEYSCPEEVSLASVLYDGADFGEHSTEWTEEERKDFLAVLEWEEFYVGALRFPRADVEALIQKKLGIPLTALDLEFAADHGLDYSEKYDVFYNAHSDSQYQAVEVIDGWLEGGLYVIHYETDYIYMGDTGLVTLKPTEDGYQFVSNVAISAATNTIHLSTAQLEKINTFLNDPDNLGFVQRTFDRPEEVQWIEVLTADVTFGVDIIEWSEGEEQALRDACGGDFTGRPVRYPRADVEKLFQKRLGLLPTELDAPISAPYLEEYDAYYCFFLGVEWVPTNVKSGKIENGIYIVDCSFGYYDESRRVTMRATDDGFQFISNVSVED